MYNDFEVASSTSTALPDNEMHDHSFVCEHANDLLQQTYEGSSNDSTENAGDNNLKYYIKKITHQVIIIVVLSLVVMHKPVWVY